MCKITGIARKRPTKEQLEQAEPVRDDNTCTWQCSFCKRANFTELNQVWTHFDTGDCPGAAVGVRTMLDNHVNGFISLGSLSDNRVNNPEDRVKIGQTIYARIVKIDIDRFSVELTSRTSDLKDATNKWKPAKDDYYDIDVEMNDQYKLDEKKKREEHKQTYTKRVIAHPQFRNIGYQQCIALLNDMEIGDAIIRPSSKGIDHLTLTWKINKGIYQHIDIVEEKKLNPFSIGKRLIIEGEDFEDLDEILARYVNPMANNVREILNYKYFHDFDDDSKKLEVIESLLLNEQRANPTRIPYFFTCDKTHPGKFLLSYMVRLKAKHEYISITPDGYKFRHQVHKSFNVLVNWFKKHHNDPITFVNPTPQHRIVPSSPFVVPIISHGANAAYNTPQTSKPTPTHSTTPQRPPYQNTLPNTMSSLSIDNAGSQQASTSTFGQDYDFNDNLMDVQENGQGQASGNHRQNNRFPNNNNGYRGNNRFNNSRDEGPGGDNYGNDKFNRFNDNNSSDGFRGRGRGRGDWRGGRGDWRGGRGDWRGGRGGGRGGGFRNYNDDGFNNNQYNNSNPPASNADENWDDEPIAPTTKQSFTPQKRFQPSYGDEAWNESGSANQARPYQKTPQKTFAAPPVEENWDEEPVQPPPARPSLQSKMNSAPPQPTSGQDNWNDRPTNSFQKTPSKIIPAPVVDENWDEEPQPVRPNIPASSNTFPPRPENPPNIPNNWNEPIPPQTRPNDRGWKDNRPTQSFPPKNPPKPSVPVEEEMWD
jgi:hypothetical protein